MYVLSENKLLKTNEKGEISQSVSWLQDAVERWQILYSSNVDFTPLNEMKFFKENEGKWLDTD
jgi:hypothetical protein